MSFEFKKLPFVTLFRPDNGVLLVIGLDCTVEASIIVVLPVWLIVTFLVAGLGLTLVIETAAFAFRF